MGRRTLGPLGSRRLVASLIAGAFVIAGSLASAAPAQAAPPPTVIVDSFGDAQAVDNPGFNVNVSGTTSAGTVQLLDGGVPVGSAIAIAGDDTAFFGYPTVNFEADVGQTSAITAVYTADSDASETPSTNSVNVFFYSQNFVYGDTWQNGATVDGVVVDLLLAPALTSDPPVQTTVTSGGTYSFSLNISTQQDATTNYITRATYPDGTVVYQNGLFGAENPNVTNLADAVPNGPVTWLNGVYEFYHDPSWTDNSLGAFRQGVAYSDGVTAAVGPAPSYAVTAGALPDGISLDPSNGSLTGTPTTVGPYDFTVTASGKAIPELGQEFTGAVIAPAAIDPAATLPTTGGDTNLPEGAVSSIMLLLVGIVLIRRSRPRT